MSRPSLVIYLPDLSGGGTERLYLRLAPWFLKAFAVTFLVDRAEGSLLKEVPDGASLVCLGARRPLRALPRLVAYLRTTRPDLVLCAMEHMNVLAVLARAIARGPTRLVVTQHNALSAQARRKGLKFRLLPVLYRLAAPHADARIAVSCGVADDMARCAALDRDGIAVIYNGAVDAGFDAAAAEPLPAFWPPEAPVILGLGRLVDQKDHATLLRAFARVARGRTCRLVIAGEGPRRADLAGLAEAEGVADHVLMPGFLRNPLPAMAHAAVVVLSSRHEGFGLVLAEALACGTPVVSTDCPHGPREILEGGRYGRLVPVGDPVALAAAIEETMEAPLDRAKCMERGRAFSVERCARDYLRLFGRVLLPATAARAE